MKKLSIVLMALLLIAGTAFAADVDFTGEAKAEVEVNFLGEEAQIVNTQDVSLDFVYTLFDKEASSAGSPPVWAEIIGSLDLTYERDEDDLPAEGWALNFGIDRAKVYFDELGLWVDILGAPDSFQFVASPIEDGWADTAGAVEAAFGDGSGLTFGIQDYEIGVWFKADWSNDFDFDYVFSLKTPELVLTPELTLEAMAALDGTDFSFGFSGVYEMDGMKFSLAGDFVDNFGEFDILLDADIAPISLSLYFLNAANQYLDAVVSADLAVQPFDKFNVGVENQMQIDTFNNKTQLFVDTELDALAAKIFGGFTMSDALDEFNVGADVGYTIDAWTFGAEVEYIYDVATEDFDLPMTFSVTSSDMFIDNADIFAEFSYEKGVTNKFTTGISMSF